MGSFSENGDYERIDCEYCNTKFQNRTDLHNHLTCRLCFVRLPSHSRLMTHNCSEKKSFLCDICNQSFISSSGLNRHRIVHTRYNNELDSFKCQQCMADFSSESSLDSHMKSFHEFDAVVKQEISPLVNANPESIEHTSYAPCSSELYDVPNNDEVNKEQKKKPFLCGICDEPFNDIDLLCEHFNSNHTGDQKVFCKICSVGCSSEEQIAAHMLIHKLEEASANTVVAPTEEYPYMCTICSKLFRKSYQMEHHVKLHTQERKFKCEQCNSGFHSKSSLDKHILIHTGHLPYVCDICKKRFRQSAALVRHKLWTHRLKNKNKCELCFKNFFSRPLLVLHLKEIHNELGKLVIEKLPTEEYDEPSADRQSGVHIIDPLLVGPQPPDTKIMDQLFVGSHSCDICHRTFRQKKLLMRHIQGHNNSRSWVCDICGKSFTTKLTRVRHAHVHLREALNPIPRLLPNGGEDVDTFTMDDLVCKECMVEFQHKSHYVRHKLLHSGIPLFKCGICNKMFVHKTDIFRHKVLHSFMFRCESCGKSFHKRSMYDIHKKKHLYLKPYLCLICGKRFTTRSNYLSHARIHSGDKPFKCNMCDYTCTQKVRLMKHKNKHSCKTFSCLECHKQFSSAKSLEVHGRVHRGIRPYKCIECPKEFCSKGGLAIHVKDHIKEVKYQCHVCPHKFLKDVHLAKHMLFHQMQAQYSDGGVTGSVFVEHLGVSLYMCDVCGRVYDKRKYLISHTNVHTKKRQFKCTQCEKMFTSKANMKNHLAVHSREKPYECYRCQRLFRHLSNLKRHEKIHDGDADTYHCEECDSIFNSKQAIEEHKQTHMNLIMVNSVVDASNSGVPQQLYVFDSVEEITDQSITDAMNNTQQLLVNGTQQQLLVDGTQQQLLVDGSQQQFLVERSQSLLVFPESTNSYSDITEHEDTTQMETIPPKRQENRIEKAQPVSNKSHECNVCFKVFAKRQYLTKHKYRHMEVKPHECDICGKRFAQRFEVATHKLKHTGEKPYQCDICFKTFRSKPNQVNHKMQHTGEYPYMCSICNKGISTQITLERHVSLHTGAFPFKCPMCRRGYSTREELVDHGMERHSLAINVDEEMDNLESIRAISSITDSSDIKTEMGLDDPASFSAQFNLAIY